jgi:signal transduction histidine kinase
LQLEAALDAPGADLRAAISGALATTDRLQATIHEILALARQAPSAHEPLDVEDVLVCVRERWHAVLAAKGKPLRLAVIGGPRPRVDATALNQILDVLIDNADRHGVGAVGLTVRALDDPAELFGQVSSTDAGHGFGLALARRLAESQGGRLRLSIPDPPTFTVLLPAADPGTIRTG